MINYYGGMAFLDDQSSLFSVFKEEIVVISSTPVKISAENMRNNLDDYTNKYMLDVFLSVFKLDYVSDTTTNSDNRLVREIYKEIISIKMDSYKRGGKLLIDIIDELYGKYIEIFAGLPIDATKWSIILYYSFNACLTINLHDNMEDDDFKIPPLNSKSNTSLQINAQSLVRIATATSFDTLLKEEACLRYMTDGGDDGCASIFLGDIVHNERHSDNYHG